MPERSSPFAQFSVTVPLALPSRSRLPETVGTTFTCCVPEYSCTLAGADSTTLGALNTEGARSGNHNAHAPTVSAATVAAVSNTHVSTGAALRVPFRCCFLVMSPPRL